MVECRTLTARKISMHDLCSPHSLQNVQPYAQVSTKAFWFTVRVILHFKQISSAGMTPNQCETWVSLLIAILVVFIMEMNGSTYCTVVLVPT